MANEYLKRTPTCTGNRQVFTWSAWIKKNIPTGSVQNLFSAGDDQIALRLNGSIIEFRNFNGGSALEQYSSQSTYTDVGSWMHITCVQDTTITQPSEDRIKLFVNGKELDKFSVLTAPSINQVNEVNEFGQVQYIGARDQGSGVIGQYMLGQMSDIFLVDGQALEPDVFGFYKDGNGYISAGSTQATDFRPGQWVPKSPSVIKNVINNSGGFGVNGFYLPMNEASNFGADFHCEPNSIITLKGEDLPQPQNGAPVTTDAYVSQLRTDPYAANIVLAVPGISTSTSATLVTNGTFDSGTTDWTVMDGASTISVDTYGRLQVDRNSGNNLNVYQDITTVIGKRYTLSANIWAGTGGNGILRAYKADRATAYGAISGATGDMKSLSFTALETTSSVILSVDNNLGNSFFDNVIVKQENAPLDYSADIKGSGTNKTLTAVGNAGVGYEIPGYYGSAMSFDGTGDYFTSSANDSDFQPGSNDYTVEAWINPVSLSDGGGIAGIYNYDGVDRRSWLLYHDSSSAVKFIVSGDGTAATQHIVTSPTNILTTNQWVHTVGEKEGNILRVYVNGVVAGIVTNAPTTLYSNTVDTFKIGTWDGTSTDELNGSIQDVRIYKGVAKYKGGFDVPQPYTPVGIGSWRAVSDTCTENFGTWNPLFPSLSGNPNPTYSNGNLTVSNANNQTTQATGTFGAPAGKWYYEARALNVTGASHMVGIRTSEFNTAKPQNSLIYRSNGSIYDYNSNVTTVSTYTDDDIIGIAFDNVTGKLWFSKNGVWTGGDPSAGTGNLVTFLPDTMNSFFAFDNVSGTQYWDTNFGQNPSFCAGISSVGTNADDSGKGLFKYAPPTGFLALCEDNLPTPAIADPGDYMRTVLWEGDGNSSRSITGVGFTPDLVVTKNRNTAGGWGWFDSVRGPGLRLDSQTTAVETSAQGVISFDSDGFSLGATFNSSDKDTAGWCWKAGGAAVSNSDGTTTSQVSANQTAGFSIVSWTGDGTNTTVGHGLGQTPNMWMVKRRNVVGSWPVYFTVLDGSLNYMYLNAQTVVSDSGLFLSGLTSSTIPVGNVSGTEYISYVWAEIEGYSKFGFYSGNGSTDGSFAYCGFKPAFLMVKRSDTAEDWIIVDSSRSPVNGSNLFLYPNLSEDDAVTTTGFDFLSNGFKCRGSIANRNASGGTYVFMAFAESPFKTANAK